MPDFPENPAAFKVALPQEVQEARFLGQTFLLPSLANTCPGSNKDQQRSQQGRNWSLVCAQALGKNKLTLYWKEKSHALFESGKYCISTTACTQESLPGEH